MSKMMSSDNEYYRADNKVIPVKVNMVHLGDVNQFQWSAPEVIDFGKFSTKSDVYSFGVTLWFEITLKFH